MNLTSLLRPERINLDLKSKKKPDALKELVAMVRQGESAELLLQTLLKREELGSTGIGQGIAIPHGKSAVAKELTAAIGISKTGVDFDALDDDKVYVIFLLVAPEEQASQHLKALARVSALLKDKYFRKALINSEGAADVIRVLEQEEKARKV